MVDWCATSVSQEANIIVSKLVNSPITNKSEQNLNRNKQCCTLICSKKLCIAGMAGGSELTCVQLMLAEELTGQLASWIARLPQTVKS